MKKFLLLACACSLVGSAYAAVGDTFTIDDVTYVVKSDNTVGIQKASSSATSFNLTDEVTNDGVTYTVVSVEEYAFRYAKAPVITLPSTVETIDYAGLYSCEASVINLPANLKVIGNYAFYACRSIQTIEIPEGVEEIGTSTNSSAFGTCYNLKSIKLPSTLKKVWDSSFYHCGLESVTLPDGVTYVGKNAFNQCDKMTEVTLSSSLEEIGPGAFEDCKSLTTINNMPASLRTIGEEAFFACPLTEFTVPADVEEIGARVFANSSVAKFNVVPENTNFKVIDEALYTADKSLLIAFPPKSATTTFTVADGCRGIQGGAFQGASVIKVTLPASVIALDDFVFCQSALSDITLTDNVVYIGEQAFAATNLTSLTLPQGLRDLQDATFAGCTKLTSITLGSNVKTFGIRQFYQCTALTDVYFTGSTAPEIGYWEYSSESPFYGVADKQVTVHCPKGTSASYSDFKDFDAVKEIVENATGIFTPTSVVPSNQSEVATLDKLTFNFGEKATAVKSNPAIKVICGQYVGNIPMGTEVEVGMWSVLNNNSESPYVVPLDEYGEDGMPVNMEAGKTYFVIVPAGTFKNVAGDLNEELTLQYEGTWVEPQFMPVTVEPLDGCELKQLENTYLTFESKPNKAYNFSSKIHLIEGELVDGVPVGTETMGSADDWFGLVENCTLQIFPCDYDAFITPIALEAGKDYYLVIDAKAVYNSSSVYNKQIIIHYTGLPESGVEAVEADSYVVKNGTSIEVGVSGESTVQVFNAAGVLVGSVATADKASFDNLASGLYIVNINTNGKAKSVKVVL